MVGTTAVGARPGLIVRVKRAQHSSGCRKEYKGRFHSYTIYVGPITWGIPAGAVNLIACLSVIMHFDLRRNPSKILVLSAALNVNPSCCRPLRFATVDTFQDETLSLTLCRERDSVQLAEKAGQHTEPYHNIRRDSLSNGQPT